MNPKRKILDSLHEDTSEVQSRFPFKCTPYYLRLADHGNLAEDPVAKQILPDPRELHPTPGDAQNYDPLNEEGQMPVPRLIHRYRDRALLIVTNQCAVHCRFCMRKRNWQSGSSIRNISDSQLDDACSYVSKNKHIREILVSGGDPLTLEICEIRRILLRISQIPSVEVIRVGTRMPVVQPSRIDVRMASMLASFKGLWVATHFNHPAEVTKPSMQSCSRLIRRGIPIVNQTVLLKGINDNSDTLEELFRKLAANKIKPLYLFHVDPVPGNSHFATGLECGIRIIRELRNRLSSLATPVFAFDLPDGGGKIHLMPDYSTPNGFTAIDGSHIQYTHCS